MEYADDALDYADDLIPEGNSGKIGGGAKTGRFIDNTTDSMTKDEKQVVDDLVGQGRIVERIPANPTAKGGTPDFRSMELMLN